MFNSSLIPYLNMLTVNFVCTACHLSPLKIFIVLSGFDTKVFQSSAQCSASLAAVISQDISNCRMDCINGPNGKAVTFSAMMKKDHFKPTGFPFSSLVFDQ